MALKGKKKSQSRGSQGRRRPAAAPRPAAASRAPRRWYRTTTGRAVAAIVAVALIGGIVAAIVGARSGAGDLERRQGSLRTFTGEVRTVLQQLRIPAGAMSEAPVTAEETELDQLRENAGEWTRTIQTAHGRLLGIPPARGAEVAQRLFAQSAQLYAGAAGTYALVDRAGAAVRDDLLRRAAEQRDQALGIWQTATEVLDEERRAAELGPSALSPPSVPGPVAPPPPNQGQGGDQGQGQGGNQGQGGGQGGGEDRGGQGDGGN
jgi:uncharacterized membrane protein YgcG